MFCLLQLVCSLFKLGFHTLLFYFLMQFHFVLRDKLFILENFLGKIPQVTQDTLCNFCCC